MTAKSRLIATTTLLILFVTGLLCANALADVPSGTGIEPLSKDNRIAPIWIWLIAAAMTGATLAVALKVSRRYDVK